MFIQVTGVDNEKIYVNFQNVLWYTQDDCLIYSGQKSLVTITFSNDSTLNVRESSEKISSLIAIVEERQAKQYAGI
mgnify:CR=1 FL=1